MASFSHVQSFWAIQLSFLGQLAQLLPAAGRIEVLDPALRLLGSAPLGSGPVANTQFGTESVTGDLRAITVGGVQRQADATTLERLATAPGESAALYLDGRPSAGNLSVGHSMTGAGGQTLLVLGGGAERGISTHVLDGGTGPLRPVHALADTAAHYLSGITAIDSLEFGGQRLVLAASAAEGGVTALRLGLDGRLTAVSSLGAAEGLPVNLPSDIAAVTLDGRAFAIVASAGTGSLTVLSVTSSGQLGFVSQVNDSRDTRFQGASTVDTLVWGGQVWVAAAGRDDGVTLFQLLPDGRLVLRDSMADSMSTALGAISDLHLVVAGGRPELLAMAPGDAGLARLRLDLGPPGAVGRTTEGADLLIGVAGGGTLYGGGGADLLVDGPGRDALSGGAGRDVFLVSADGVEDRILDFNRSEDRIDLTSVAGLRSPAGLAISSTTTGARISWDSESLIITTQDRRPIQVAEMVQLLCFRTDRIDMPDMARWLTLSGSAGADTLNGTLSDETFMGGAGGDWITPGEGSDSVDGGTGRDMLSYADVSAPVTINLSLGTVVKTTGTDRLSGFENATGSVHGDQIAGDGNANLLRGLGGYDWFTATWGADTYDGGTGRDMVSYVNAPARVIADLGRGLGTEGMARDHVYQSIERLTGSVFSDVFYGAAGEEDFRGLGGDDWFVGSGGGKDRYDGGTGRDTVAYSGATGGVAASLLLDRGTAGDAARDLYTAIENLTGSSHVDQLTGDHDRNVLRGLAGDDLLIGLDGNDRLEGGRGNDRLDGGSGWDYALFSGDRREYTITAAAGATTLSHIGGGREDGTDSLRGIEVLVFADGLVFL